MANVVKRFVCEAILRQKSEKYVAIFKLDDGKYYRMYTDAYSYGDAERQFKKSVGYARSYHEIEPSKWDKAMVELHDYLYVLRITGD